MKKRYELVLLRSGYFKTFDGGFANDLALWEDYIGRLFYAWSYSRVLTMKEDSETLWSRFKAIWVK